MKRQKETIGSIVELILENGKYAYAQLLENGTAFFDYLAPTSLKDFSVLEGRGILFIVAIYKDVITHGHWLKVGKLPIRKELEILPLKFIQDAIHPDQFELYDPNSGKTTSVSKEECRGLERASVWDQHHIEDRIRDYYEGNPCLWLKKDYELWGENDKVQWLIKHYALK